MHTGLNADLIASSILFESALVGMSQRKKA